MNGILRDKTPGRITGRRLQRMRQEHFRANPLCVRCQAKGVIRLATVLDHITPLAKEKRPDAPDMPRQGLCKRCHDIKTAEDFGIRHTVRYGLDGNPIDE